MKIGLIMHPYGEKEEAGLGKAIFSLSKAIIESDVTNSYTIFVKGSPKINPEIEGKNWKITFMPEHFLWLDEGLRKAEKQDVYIFFTPFIPFLSLPGKKVVLAHDFAYKYIPTKSFTEKIKRIVLHFIHKRSLVCADSIVAISQYTKSEIILHFGIAEEKIHMIYNGFTPVCDIPPQTNNTVDKYFLFTGVIKPRKNVLMLVQAYELARRNQGDVDFPKLIIVGKGGGAYFQTIKDFVITHKLSGNVIFAGYASREKLQSLYVNTLALVFPSLIEGFGLPILEGMQCGVPVITSNTGAMKEIAGNAALLVDPNDTNALAQALTTISEDSALRDDLVVKGYARQGLFSWAEAAKQYHEILRKI